MKNKTAQTSTQKLGLVFDFNAMTVLEEKFGMNVLDHKSLEKLELTPAVARQFVWVGLMHKHPNITIEEAGKKVKLPELGEVIAEIQNALTKAFTGK